MNRENSPALFIFLATMLLVVTLSARAPLDADMWWHLRSGEMTLANGQPLLEDVFSYTRSGEAWTNHSWLAQVVLYLSYRSAGFGGLAVYTAVLAAASMALVYRLMDGPPLLKAFLVILCAASCALVWTPRPQMFSLMFFALLFNLLADYKKKKGGPLWVIPILFALWSNLHGGFPIGLALLAVFTAAEAANRVFLYEESECLSWAQIKRLALWSLTAVPALLINPNGIKTWLIPFQTVGITALQNLIQEWASPDFHEISQQMILWLLFLLVLSFSAAGRRVPFGELLLPLAFAYMTFLARRNIAAFAMVSVPAASRGLVAAWQTWRTRAESAGGFRALLRRHRLPVPNIENRQVSPSVSRLVNLAMIAFLGALAFGRLGIMSLEPVVQRYIREDYPVDAVAWLRGNKPEGRVLSEYNWGGYLVFTDPSEKVFVDGRTDLYGDEIIGEWYRVVMGDPEWRAILEKWGVEAVLLQPDKPVLGLMAADGWLRGFEDGNSVVMIRR